MPSRPYGMIIPARQGVTSVTRQMILICILVLMIAGEGSVAAQNVQTGHYAPGWNGNLKAGMMAQAPGFYMQSTTMYFNARNFKDGSGDTASSDETDYLLTSLALVLTRPRLLIHPLC